MLKIFLTSIVFILITLKMDSNIYTIHLGKSPDCNGFNFCSITSTNANEKRENEVLAYITVNDEKHIEFSFIKRSISDQLFLKYFSTGTFLLDDDFIFSNEICEALKIERCRLKQGKYQILDGYDKYVVVFTY